MLCTWTCLDNRSRYCTCTWACLHHMHGPELQLDVSIHSKGSELHKNVSGQEGAPDGLDLSTPLGRELHLHMSSVYTTEACAAPGPVYSTRA